MAGIVTVMSFVALASSRVSPVCGLNKTTISFFSVSPTSASPDKDEVIFEVGMEVIVKG